MTAQNQIKMFSFGGIIKCYNHLNTRFSCVVWFYSNGFEKGRGRAFSLRPYKFERKYEEPRFPKAPDFLITT